MRNAILLAVFLVLIAPASYAEITPEESTVETLGQPNNDWFINISYKGGYLFDSADGSMLGLLSLSDFTPAIAVNRSRGEVYAAESYFSRVYRGTREDVLTVYDIRTMSPVSEIDIPDHFLEVKAEPHSQLMGQYR